MRVGFSGITYPWPEGQISGLFGVSNIRNAMGTTSLWRVPLDIKTDCQSVLDHLKSLRMFCEEKKLFGAVDMLREAVKVSEIHSVQHVKTEFMVADGLTKPTPSLKGLLIDALNGSIIVPLNWRQAAHGVDKQRIESLCFIRSH
jgi:hypothetical protein